MSVRARAFAVALAGLLLAGCPGPGAKEEPVVVHGLSVEEISPDHTIALSDGLVIQGDARLAEALRAGGTGIADVTLLERMPPVVVVRYDDGEARRYRTRRAGR